jgi:hypothetical protein
MPTAREPELGISIGNGRVAKIEAKGAEAVRSVNAFIWALAVAIVIVAAGHRDIAGKLYELGVGAISRVSPALGRQHTTEALSVRVGPPRADSSQ